MKAKLIFDLNDPDDITAHLRATKALDLCICLNDIKEGLRRKVKYGDLSEHDLSIYESLQSKFFEILEECDINLDELIR